MQSGLDESLSVSEKQRLYSEPRIAELLKLIARERKRIEPSIGQDGKVHWEIVEKVIPSNEIDVEALLEHLVKAGILTKTPVRNLIICPVDERADFLTQLSCPRCDKTTLSKVSLISHNLCGFIGDRSKFIVADTEKLVCPKCNREIRNENDLRLVGVWFECTSCGARTNSPNIIFECKEGHKFKIANLLLKTVYAYEMPQEVIKELKLTEVLGPSLKDTFISLGFSVEQPAEVAGKSGAIHRYDLYARKGDSDISIEVVVDSKPVDQVPLITYFAKTFDTRTKYPILVVIPDATEQLRTLSRTYNIKVITDSDGTGVVQKIKSYISEIGLA